MNCSKCGNHMIKSKNDDWQLIYKCMACGKEVLMVQAPVTKPLNLQKTGAPIMPGGLKEYQRNRPRHYRKK